MFDELNKSDNSNVRPPVYVKPPSPVIAPFKTEDIFAEVDKTDKPDVFKTDPNNNQPPRGTVLPPETGWKSNKLMVFGLLFGGLIVVAAGGYLGLKMAVKGGQTAISPVVQEQAKTPEVNKEVAPVPEVNKQVVEPVQPDVSATLDSDQDGLTDQEEASLGTNPNNYDTDKDGLTDREEVKVYKTNPLSADTDGDGFKDGDEVNNGYNPNGTGKLLEIK